MNAISNIALPRPPYPDAVILWHGRPDMRAAAVRIWHVRAVLIYFLALLFDGATMRLRGPFPESVVLVDEAKLLLMGLVVIGLLIGLAWLTVRTTTYTVTDHCLIMRFGIALQARLIIPFAAVERVEVRVHRDHTGDVTLRLKADQAIPYLKLWPHVRPWWFARPEPMLRGIEAPGVVGTLLSRAVAARHAAKRAEAAVKQVTGPVEAVHAG